MKDKLHIIAAEALKLVILDKLIIDNTVDYSTKEVNGQLAIYRSDIRCSFYAAQLELGFVKNISQCTYSIIEDDLEGSCNFARVSSYKMSEDWTTSDSLKRFSLLYDKERAIAVLESILEKGKHWYL